MCYSVPASDHTNASTQSGFQQGSENNSIATTTCERNIYFTNFIIESIEACFKRGTLSGKRAGYDVS